MDETEFRNAWRDRLKENQLTDRLKTQLRSMVLTNQLESMDSGFTDLSRAQKLLNRLIMDYVDDRYVCTASVFSSETKSGATDRHDLLERLHTVPGLSEASPVLEQLISTIADQSIPRISVSMQTESGEQTLYDAIAEIEKTYESKASKVDRGAIERDIRNSVEREFEHRLAQERANIRDAAEREVRDDMARANERALRDLDFQKTQIIETLRAQITALKGQLDDARSSFDRQLADERARYSHQREQSEEALRRTRVELQSRTRSVGDREADIRDREARIADAIHTAVEEQTGKLNAQVVSLRTQLTEAIGRPDVEAAGLRDIANDMRAQLAVKNKEIDELRQAGAGAGVIPATGVRGGRLPPMTRSPSNVPASTPSYSRSFLSPSTTSPSRMTSTGSRTPSTVPSSVTPVSVQRRSTPARSVAATDVTNYTTDFESIVDDVDELVEDVFSD